MRKDLVMRFATLFSFVCVCGVIQAATGAEAPCFQENFDGKNWAPGKLKGVERPGIEIVTEPVASSPHALKVSRTTGPAFADARFDKPSPAGRDLVVSFRIRLGDRGRGDLALLNRSGKPIASLILRVGSVPLVQGDDGFVACQDIPALTANEWLRFEWAFNAIGKTCRLTRIASDGRRIEDGRQVGVKGELPAIGFRFFNSPNGGEAFYDDLSAEIRTPDPNEKSVSAARKPSAASDLKKITDHLKSPVPEYWRWVFYGDSITHGYGNTRGWRSYPELFEECLRYECGFPRRKDVVINSGLSGHRSENLLDDSNYIPLVRNLKPQVVFLLIGANDIVVPGMTPERFRANMEKLVAKVRADGAIPVLQTFNTMLKVENPVEPYQKGYLQRYSEFPAYNKAIRDLAEHDGCLLVDHTRHWEKHAADVRTLAGWMDDELHPGARGHYEMAKLIIQTFGMDSGHSRCLEHVPPVLSGKGK